MWYPVTPAMGKASFDGPECIKEVIVSHLLAFSQFGWTSQIWLRILSQTFPQSTNHMAFYLNSQSLFSIVPCFIIFLKVEKRTIVC